jgi:hypothetical protein
MPLRLVTPLACRSAITGARSAGALLGLLLSPLSTHGTGFGAEGDVVAIGLLPGAAHLQDHTPPTAAPSGLAHPPEERPWHALDLLARDRMMDF